MHHTHITSIDTIELRIMLKRFNFARLFRNLESNTSCATKPACRQLRFGFVAVVVAKGGNRANYKENDARKNT